MFKDYKHQTLACPLVFFVLSFSLSSRLLCPHVWSLVSRPLFFICCLGWLPSSPLSRWFDGSTSVALLLWRCGCWSKGSFFCSLLWKRKSLL